MRKFNFQMFKGNTTNTTTYEMSPEERQLLVKQMGYLDEIYPNMIKLNTSAGELLFDSFGDVQADFSTLNQNAQNQLAGAQQGVAGLINGQLPQAYTDNMTAAIKSGVQNTVGDMINTLGQKGVLNSSVTNKATNDIETNVANTMAQQYGSNIDLLSGLYGQQIDAADDAIVTTAAAQQAAQQPALNLWTASLGLNSANTDTLGAVAGKLGTTTQTQKTSGGGLGSFLGNAVGNWLGNSGYVGSKW